MEYDNNRPFSSEGAAQERKRKHALGKGFGAGLTWGGALFQWQAREEK